MQSWNREVRTLEPEAWWYERNVVSSVQIAMQRVLRARTLGRHRSSALAALAGSLLTGALVLPLGQPARAQNMVDNMIRKFCLQAVNKEIQASGKPAPAGMQDYTCNCVVQEMRRRQSQEQAAATCKAAAARKFNL